MDKMIKNMFSIIIPTHKLYKRLDGKYEIEACIDSILEQDYRNYEIIVAANGEDRKDVIKWCKGRKLRWVETATGNACSARNAGAHVAQGEFYTFFSSDFVMYPGCLRIWKEAFDDNPEAVMVYSGYDLTQNGQKTATRSYTFEFDRYKLECFNYIDGGFPVRASAHKPWDINCKALNDWDWVLSLTDNGEKMKMIKDVGYSAEVPKPGGLSDYSSNHWQELKDYIQTKHGIKKHKWVFTSLGAPYHGERTAKAYGESYLPMPSCKPHDFEAVVLLGYYVMGGNQIHHNHVFLNAKPGAMRVIQWIGTDIAQMMAVDWTWNKNCVLVLNEYINLHLAECKFTQYELKEMGIDAKVLPLPVDTSTFSFIRSKPKRYTISVYNPKGDADTHQRYQLAFCLQLAKSLPDIGFLFYGGGSEDSTSSPNVKYLPWIPIQEVAKRSNVNLRITLHDGLPMSTVEFLMMGRDAICTVPNIEGSYYAGRGDFGPDDLEKQLEMTIFQIRHLQKHPTKLATRKKASEYWRKELDPVRCKRKLTRYLKEADIAYKKKVKKFARLAKKRKGLKK